MKTYAPGSDRAGAARRKVVWNIFNRLLNDMCLQGLKRGHSCAHIPQTDLNFRLRAVGMLLTESQNYLG